jgi:hypothetical protein
MLILAMYSTNLLPISKIALQRGPGVYPVGVDVGDFYVRVGHSRRGFVFICQRAWPT